MVRSVQMGRLRQLILHRLARKGRMHPKVRSLPKDLQILYWI